MNRNSFLGETNPDQGVVLFRTDYGDAREELRIYFLWLLVTEIVLVTLSLQLSIESER